MTSFRNALIWASMLAGTTLGAPLALAQQPDEVRPEREVTLLIYGDDPCPAAQGDEIVVCARRPEEERYRIPPALRQQRDRPTEVSWGSRVDALEDASRDMRPNSCSVVGSGGQSGCGQALIRQWRAERRARR